MLFKLENYVKMETVAVLLTKKNATLCLRENIEKNVNGTIEFSEGYLNTVIINEVITSV